MGIKLKQNVLEILKTLQEKNIECDASELAKDLNLDYIVLMSAVNDLVKVNLGGFKEKYLDYLYLTDEGLNYLKKGLPSRQLINYLVKNKIKEISIAKLKEKSELTDKPFYRAIQNLRRNKWIATSKATGENKVFLVADDFPNTELEVFLKTFEKKPFYDKSKLSKEEVELIEILNKRNLIRREKSTQRLIFLTPEGKKIDVRKIEILKEVSKITSEMLISGEWKHINLKPFNVSISGPRIHAGKIHPLINIINEIREIFLSMGFTEIKGPIVESAFFNFDALFQPQDHPAREMQDTFYLNNPKQSKLPERERVEAVKATHENGGGCGSIGWGYDWSYDIAKKVVLRTHTTATTCRRLAQFYRENEKPPVKVFSIDKVFRNERLDHSHLAEFMQIEGIVIDENVTLCDLRGLLTEFYRKMGFSKIITRPSFFPYTEPSLEIAVYSEKLGEWLELGGSGIFRPEVTYPWGIKDPTRVLAWGLGLERLAMLKYGREDIRDLYRNPLKWLREVSY